MIPHSFSYATDKGAVRGHNEDSLVFVSQLGLYAVADGMGGAAAGEYASREACAVLGQEYRDTSSMTMPERLTHAFQSANAAVYDASRKDSAKRGMGTTLVALAFDGTKAYIANVGDSRCYIMRGGCMKQLSEDHSVHAEVMRQGYSKEYADSVARKNVITRAIGTSKHVQVDGFTVTPEPGDMFLLCSDGLTGALGDDIIASIMSEEHWNGYGCAQVLVDAANASGADDNVTAIVVWCQSERAA